MLSFHRALFSYPHGDDTEQRSPWALATLCVPLRLHSILAGGWVREGRKALHGHRAAVAGAAGAEGFLDGPQVPAASPGPARALSGWVGGRVRSLETGRQAFPLLRGEEGSSRERKS